MGLSAVIVADEPASALDVSIQAQVANLLMDLQEQRGLSDLFIGHNLAVVEHVADEVAVMHRGCIVEQRPGRALFAAPAHPYTRALIDSLPDLDTAGQRIARRPLPEAGPPTPGGCAFAPRCPRAAARCRAESPALREIGDGRRAACHFA